MTEDTRPGSLPASPGDPPEADASPSPDHPAAAPSPGAPPGAPAGGDPAGPAAPGSEAPAPAASASGTPAADPVAAGELVAAGEPAPAGEAPAESAPPGEAPAEPAPEGQAADGQPAGAEAQAGPSSGGPSGGGRPTLIVRYGAMGLLGRFACSADRWRRDQRVVIKSDRGMEIGTVVCAWSGGGGCCAVGPQFKGEVLRAVTHVDEIEERHLQETADREFAYCKQCIADRKMPMKLASVEHLFGGDRIIFYFVSESRVDFRDLVRDLAHEFQTRIEMRQIGVRDEARLLGDYEKCGRPLCCRAWIKSLEPVSMKMAKVQKATLDPAKISGRCGRLMCCLRFEHNTYRELAKNLPRKNTLVGTTEGRGKVVDTDVVTQLVGVLLESGTRINVPVESLIDPEAAPATAPAAAPPAGRDRGSRDAGRDRGARDAGRDAGRDRGARDAGRGPRPAGPPAPPPPAAADDEVGVADMADEVEPAELSDADDDVPESRCIPRPDAPPRPPRPQAAPDGRRPGQPDGRPGQPAGGQPGQPPDGKRGRRGRRGRRRSRRGGRGPRPEGGPGGGQGARPGGNPGQGPGPGAAP